MIKEDKQHRLALIEQQEQSQTNQEPKVPETMRKLVIKLMGIIKRNSKLQFSQMKLQLRPTIISDKDRSRFVVDVFKDEERKEKIGYMIFFMPLTVKNFKLCVVTRNRQLINAIEKHLHLVVQPERSEQQEDSVIKLTKFDKKIGDQFLYSYGFEFDEQSYEKLKTRLTQPRVQVKQQEKTKQPLEEATSSIFVSNGEEGHSAPIKFKGRTPPLLLKLVTKLKNSGSTIHKIEDNGIHVKLTVGQKDKPTVDILFQRKAVEGVTSLRLLGIPRVRRIVDINGIAMGTCFAVVGVDGTNATTSTEMNTTEMIYMRLKAQNAIKAPGIRRTDIIASPINEELINEFVSWWKVTSRMNSMQHMIWSWSQFLTDHAPVYVEPNKDEKKIV